MTTDIQQFPPDIVSTLVALPYRVGLYVSKSDKTGGQESENEELKALENMVTFYVEDTLKSEFAQSVMLMTLQQKYKWPSWQDNIDMIPQECQDMTSYLEDHLDTRNLAAFKNNLLEIGITVAMAYQENSDSNTMGFIRRLFSKKKKSNVDDTGMENISGAEKIALDKLASVMGIAHKLS